MKKTLMCVAALPTFAIAAPAMAQNYNAGGGVGIQNRIVQLETRVNAGIQAGTIDRSEARTLRMRLRDLARLERQYSRNGLTQSERQDLQARLRAVRDEVRLADNNRQGYGYTGQGGPYETYDSWNDGYDPRYQQQPVQQRDRGLLGGLVDRVFGGGGLSVGQRVTGNLGGVPYGYQNQYRDGGGYYYRSDGRQIYAVDARSHTVVRVYPMNR